MKKEYEKRRCVAVMGVGNWGSKLVRVFNSIRDVDLRWVADPDPEACKRAVTIAPNVRTASDISEVLDDVEAVAVCTPAKDHFEHSRFLLGKGKDVFSEKPFAMRTYDAVSLKSAGEAADAVLMVGHQLLFHPVFLKLKKLVKKGVLGKIESIRAERTGPIDLEREPGVLWSYGPHDVAMILSLVEEVPTSVAAKGIMAPGMGDVSQMADVRVEFQGGIEASIQLSAIEKRRRRLTVNGDKGTAVFDDTKPGGRLFLLDSSDSDTKVEDLDLATGEPLALELEHFVSCIGSRETPLTGPDHAIKVTALLDEASECLTHKRNRRLFPINAVFGIQ